MSPRDVGADGSKIILSARSGRRAIQYRFKSLGIFNPITSSDEMFREFKAFADQRSVVTDAELLALYRSLAE